jgi:hypothetical protein
MALRQINSPMPESYRQSFDNVVPYLDAFDPAPFVPAEHIPTIATDIIHPLLRALAAEGLRPYVGHDLRTVEKIQDMSAGRMRLVQANNPKFHPNASPDDTNVLVLMQDETPRGCVASRLIWCERTLAEEMESGRFWVSHPLSMWTDKCIVDSYIAKVIKACPVIFTGSIFLFPGATGGNALAALLRLHYLWAVCHWRWSWGIGLIEGALIRRHAFDIYGAMSLDMGVWRTRQGSGEELHRYEITVCEREAAMNAWLRPEMGDLSRPMGRPPRSVLPVEGERERVAPMERVRA